MSKTYIAVNGQEITEEMINRWSEAYERGEFPEGEHTVGPVVYGHPSLSTEGTAAISAKIPAGIRRAIEKSE